MNLEDLNVSEDFSSAISRPAREELSFSFSELMQTVLSHQKECSPTSLESLRELGDNSKNFSVVVNHRIIPVKAVVVSLYTIMSHCSKSRFFHNQDEGFVIDGSNEQNWDTTVTDEYKQILMNAKKNCGQFYITSGASRTSEILMDTAKMRELMRKVKRCSANAECYNENGQVLEKAVASML
ncbi:unnamed protein product [Wuchereria bancrofti]|uniref:Uncharacterized protein n=1 Tax=Wuchereria bancrofti TaxID=6293 RepID=A0A3P7FXM6_WUCBA|nr:unnamed protein product [Wuchereria bancrofti]